ncbi:enoyl-CoA hydratase-related protein [Streptomyces sp. NPDC002088]|uniref:enoyl-CoA hydratase-related protein n=1 Tax=Streptomyces sp. NPDC002088 TaxID=3154665 RepID=UPI00331BE536
MTQPLLRDVDDGVAILTFNRPDSANAWSVDLHVAYLEALRELAVDKRVRAVVVTGAGRHFCVGADLSQLDAVQNGEELPPELTSDSLLEPIDFPKPLIAAVNGSAAGIGLVHTLLCDVRFASENALFTTSFAERGLVAEHGVSWLLPQVVGRGHALDLLLSARRVGAAEAERIGLVHRVVPAYELMQTAVAYARQLAANCSPAAMQMIKKQVTRHSTLQLTEAENETLPLVDRSLTGADFKEGVLSFVERRVPHFPPLGRGTSFDELPSVADPGAVAEKFFAATVRNDWDAALALLSPRARVANHPGPPPSGVEGLTERWQRLRDSVGPWEYVNVRRLVADNGFCEQHLVRFTDLGVEAEACVVASLDDKGLIVSLDEYVDGAALRDAIRRRREEQPEPVR